MIKNRHRKNSRRMSHVQGERVIHVRVGPQWMVQQNLDQESGHVGAGHLTRIDRAKWMELRRMKGLGALAPEFHGHTDISDVRVKHFKPEHSAHDFDVEHMNADGFKLYGRVEGDIYDEHGNLDANFLMRSPASQYPDRLHGRGYMQENVPAAERGKSEEEFRKFY